MKINKTKKGEVKPQLVAYQKWVDGVKVVIEASSLDDARRIFKLLNK